MRTFQNQKFDTENRKWRPAKNKQYKNNKVKITFLRIAENFQDTKYRSKIISIG